MTVTATPDINEARKRFPATERVAYFNTAAVGLASRTLADAYHSFIDAWARKGLDFAHAEAAADQARGLVARLMGVSATDVALIPSVSSAAGLVAAQFGPATRGQNVVIGEREYSSNHFPWRQLAHKGYDVRQVPFRNGGLEPEAIGAHIDEHTRLVAFSAVQAASGHRSDIRTISVMAHAVGATVFVDGSQLVGALPVGDLADVDVLATADHKFLLHAGRGMGYCYFSPAVQERFVPIGAGWRAGRVPFESFFGPAMNLSTTASRFDASISWVAAIGNVAALSVFEEFGPDAVYARNRALVERLRGAVAAAGWSPVSAPADTGSTLVAIPLGKRDPGQLLRTLGKRDVVAAARDGNLRLSIHFYNHEDDIDRLVVALSEL